MTEKSWVRETFPYLYQVDKLKFSYPYLGTFANRILNTQEQGRQLVAEKCVDDEGYYRPPGRCCILEFRAPTDASEASVTPVHLKSESSIRKYLQKHSPIDGSSPVPSGCQHRLYILEDLAPEYVELLGLHLQVDPVVFARQMNSWRFLNTSGAGHRVLPSLQKPDQTFSVRYPELRCFNQPLDDWWTFAVNRRKIDPWYPIPGGRVRMRDNVAIVRHCMSFWVDNPNPGNAAWNALLLVDPAINAFKAPDVPAPKPGMPSYRVLRKGPASSSGFPTYESDSHSSRPFHYSHPDPIPVEQAIKFTAEYRSTHPTGNSSTTSQAKAVFRRKASLFDETILYWTQQDNQDMILSAIKNPCDTTTYALKIVAYHWTNLLELILLALNQGEFVAHDERHPMNYFEDAKSRGGGLFTSHYKRWKEEISYTYEAIYFFNIFRRRLAFYEDDLDLALESLNPRNIEDIHNNNMRLSALQSATLDFKALSSRLKLYKARADTLASSADEIVNLRSVAKSLDDSAFNLRLAIFAAIVFPGTLIAAIFGMSDGFKPGDEQFWIFWVVSVPLIVLMVMVMAGWGKFANVKRN